VTARDPARPLVVASNRGPVSFSVEGEELVPHRGAGGLAAAMSGALRAVGGVWVAAAMGDGDRAAARRAGGRFRAEEGDPFELRYLDLDPDLFDGYYNGIANRTLWFCHHRLWNVPYEPRWDEGTARAWGAYVEANRTFAGALAEEGGRLSAPAYLIQDYHLSLLPALLRERIPGAPVLHFSHSPFAGPDDLSILPEDLWRGVLTGMLGADVVGFHTPTWADRFLACCAELLEAKVDRRRRRIEWRGRRVHARVYPLGIDGPALRAEARRPSVRTRRRGLDRELGDQAVVLRADRLELSKNVVRGFQAFGELLRHHPEWRRRVTFLACLYPSRQDVPEYRDYARACHAAARAVNEEFGEPGWEPVRLSVEDDVERVLAAYARYDVLFVNPVVDGMNLVAKEGPALNRRDGVLVLSRSAGAFEELGGDAVPVNPFDVGGMAGALHAALSMSPEERARRARALRRRIGAGTPARWIARQLRDLEAATASRPG